MNMKSIILLTLIIAISAFAHRTLLMVDDNGDGTIYIEAGLSSGGSAAGATVTLTDRATGRPLWQGEISEDGTVTTDRPDAPYSVTLSMGDGHAVTQKGPDFITVDEVEDTTVVSADTTVMEVVEDTTSDEVSTGTHHSHGDKTHTH